MTIVNRTEATMSKFVGGVKVLGCLLKLHVGEDWDTKFPQLIKGRRAISRSRKHSKNMMVEEDEEGKEQEMKRLNHPSSPP